MKISIGSDHAGYRYKAAIIAALIADGHEVNDHGTFSENSVDFPDYVHPVGNDLDKGIADKGIVLCGSGNGAAITANKHESVRCALCWNEETAGLARQHNDANTISIPARFVSEILAIEMVRIFLSTDFDGGRHLQRVQKIKCS